MNNSDWEILVTLAQKRNITKTAEVLFLAQPSLSYRLRRIEAEFGVSLFDRVPSGVTLTPQGERLAAYAQDMRLRYRALRDDLSDMAPVLSGTLLVRMVLPGVLSLGPAAAWGGLGLRIQQDEIAVIQVLVIHGRPPPCGIRPHGRFPVGRGTAPGPIGSAGTAWRFESPCPAWRTAAP